MIRLEPATPSQLPVLAPLEQITFRHTFASFYDSADFEAFMSEFKTPEAIALKLSQPGTFTYIALEDRVAAGFLTLNLHKQPDTGTLLQTPVMEIEQIYVHPDFQGQGVGKLLMQQAYAIAAENAVATIWLGVWEHNVKAQQFYVKEGFEQFGAHIFRVGTQEDNDWLMKKTMQKG